MNACFKHPALASFLAEYQGELRHGASLRGGLPHPFSHIFKRLGFGAEQGRVN